MLEAGPCPVTASAPRSATATRPSSSPSAPQGEGADASPSSGTARRPTPRRCATSPSSATRPASSSWGRPSPPTRSRRATRSRSPASRRARASRARSSATTSAAARSPTARTTSAPRARSARRPRPSRVFKGLRGPGQMGNKRITQKGLTVVEVDAGRQPAARPRRRARPARRHRGGADRWLAPRASAPPARWSSTPPPGRPAGTSPSCTRCVRAELNARRQGTASTKTRGLVRGGGAKPWRQKGTGRARAGLDPRSPIWTGGGIVFGPQPRHYTFKVNRKARRAAFRSALSVHAGRGSLAVFDAAAPWTTRRPSRRSSCSAAGDAPRGRVLCCCTRTRRTPASPSATSSASTCCRSSTRASPTSSAPPRSSSPSARSRTHRPRRGHTREREDAWRWTPARSSSAPSSPRSRSCSPSSASTRSACTSKAHKTQIRQAIEALFPDVKVRRGPHLVRQVQAQAPRLHRRPLAAWKKAVVQVRQGDTIPIFQGLEATE